MYDFVVKGSEKIDIFVHFGMTSSSSASFHVSIPRFAVWNGGVESTNGGGPILGASRGIGVSDAPLAN